LLALAAGLIGASAAQATITSSSITTPTDPTFMLESPNNVTVSGTTNSSAPGSDEVDIDCYEDNGSTVLSSDPVATSVHLNGSGAFSTTVTAETIYDNTPTDDSECRLRAVPAGTTPSGAGLAAFAGPRVGADEVTPYTIASGPNIGAIWEYYILAQRIGGGDDFDGLGSCGLSDSFLMDAATFGLEDSQGFFCNDFLANPADVGPSRSGALVDGHNAYPPHAAYYINNQATGFPALAFTAAITNPVTGDLTITDSEPLVECAGDPFPANAGNCPSFTPSGVQDHRTITQTHDGHIVLIDDQYSSTDGHTHTLNLLLQQDQAFKHGNGMAVPANISYEFPGQAAFATHVGGDTVLGTSGVPASILVESNVQPDGSTLGGRGAITYAAPPAGSFAFLNGTDASFDAPVVLNVPAGGVTELRYVYSTETTSAAVAGDVLLADDMVAPLTLAFSSPLAATTVSTASFAVTGIATAGSGVKSVSVNGVPATITNGTFTALITLTRGANTLTATLTSNSGNTTSVAEPVTYTPVPPTLDLSKFSISHRKHSASFTFTAGGESSGFLCALVHVRHGKRHKKQKPRYSTCSSPITYKHLKVGHYIFDVKAAGPGGTSPTTSHKFKIG
jgi:hypothetical protein